MARISSYTQDPEVGGNDKLVGTSSGGTTQTYTINTIGDYYVENNVISVAGQQNVKFIDDSDDLSGGVFFIPDFGGDNLSLENITQLCISKTSTTGKDVERFYRDMFDKKFRLASIDEPSHFVDLKVTTILDNQPLTGYLKISVTVEEASGTLNAGDLYAFSAINLSDTFVFTQESVSKVWSIEHNLNKYPAVTVVDSGDNVLYTEVEYIDKRNLEVRFEASTSGKAYLN